MRDLYFVAQDLKQEHLTLLVRLFYAKNLFALTNYSAALKEGETVLKEAKKHKNLNHILSAYELLSDIYMSKNQYKEAYSHLKQSRIFVDSVYKSGKSRDRLIQSKSLFDNYILIEEQKIKDKSLKNQALQIEKQAWLLSFFLVLALCVFPLIWFLIRNIKKERFLKTLIEKQMNEFQISSNLELENKQKELTSNALLTAKSNELTTTLLQKIKEFKTGFILKAKERKAVEEMEEIIKNFSPNKDWGEFKLYFEKVDRAFFNKLETQYPQLTPNEVRLCALIYLNLNSKEIAHLTSRSSQSVRTAKTRLKKKMCIPESSNLYEYFHKL